MHAQARSRTAALMHQNMNTHAESGVKIRAGWRSKHQELSEVGHSAGAE